MQCDLGLKGGLLTACHLFVDDYLSGLGERRLRIAWSALPGPDVCPNFFCSSAAAARAAAFCDAELADMAGIGALGLVLASARS